MNTEKSHEEWIESFLDKSLSADEEEAFKAKLASDQEFERIYHERLKLKRAWILAFEYEKAKEELLTVIKREKWRKHRRITVYAIAASLFLVLGIPSLLHVNMKQNPNQAFVNEDSTQIDRLNDNLLSPEFQPVEEKASSGTFDSLQHTSPVDSTHVTWEQE